MKRRDAPRKCIWGFPKIRGTILGVPVIRTMVFWGLYWGPLILANYHIRPVEGGHLRPKIAALAYVHPGNT